MYGCESPEFDLSSDATRPASSLSTGSGGTASVGGSAGAPGEGGRGPDHCHNGVPDANETGTDCGGPDCNACPVGEPCRSASDCVNGECTLNICRNASCNDEILDGTETDIDCGGDSCPACGPGKACLEAADCASLNCGDDAICEAATCDDRIHNGTESDIDCGGSCPGCEVGDRCSVSADCQPPPDASTESIHCDADTKTCVLLCGTGTADCNRSARDGCEVTLSSDIEHCGECGHACELSNAEAQCQGGECLIVTCEEGFRNCNQHTGDGCETDIESDPNHCGACHEQCSGRNGTAQCAAGRCSIECDEGFDDCNAELADGCEANLNRSVDHCQECSQACEASGAGMTAFCDGAADGCGETECDDAVGDCDGDGECTDDLTSIDDCGRCGNTCHVPNGTPGCTGGACTVAACDSGKAGIWADCDESVINGCERNLYLDARACGACDNDCREILDAGLNVTEVGCSAGACVITSCEAGFADCDGEFDNGCEVDTTTDAERCGGCSGQGGIDCTEQYANGSGMCKDSTCHFAGCDATWADCNQDAGAGSSGDGCETSIAFNDEHCGACGLKCQVSSGTTKNTCGGANGDTCQPVCAADYASCDGDPANGCETSLLDDDEHCGACNNECEDLNSDNRCSQGVCEPDCHANFASCDDDPDDGCEQSITTAAHCGDCRAACSGANGGTPACSVAGQCSVSCPGSFKSCNDENKERDGCETDTASDPDHCGACGASCGATNVDVRACNEGECAPACNPGFCRSSDPRNGCTLPLGTPDNCSACGDSCSAPQPFCESDGGFHCDFLDIEVVNSGTTAVSSGWDGTTNTVLTVNHALESSRGEYRLAVIGVAARAEPYDVRYDGAPLEPVVSEGIAESWAGIYVVLDADLPAPGIKQVRVQLTPGSGWGFAGVEVTELTGVDQNTPIHTMDTTSTESDCGTGGLRSIGLTFSDAAGSFVYAVLGARNASTATFTDPVDFVETMNRGITSPQTFRAVAGHIGPRATGTIASWAMSGCWESAGAAIGIHRAESL